MESITNEVLTEENKTENVLPDTEGQHSHAELSQFSKRYSRAGRREVAEKIRELRFKHAKKTEANSALQESVDEKKIEVEKLKKEQEDFLEEIKTLEKEVEAEKAKLWSKVQSFFKKIELEQELQVETKNKKIEDIKKEVAERLKIIGEMEDAISDTSLLQGAKEALTEFYKEQSNLKSTFETEEAKRSIENISKENDCVFIHGIPWKDHIGSGNVSENNSSLKAAQVTPEERIALLMGLQPTISTAVLKEGTRHEGMYPFGVILGGGRVLTAYDDDEGTVAETIYYRKSKFDHDLKTKTTTIQPNIETNISKSLLAPRSNSYHPYNEFVVEEPKIAGFYINVSDLDSSSANRVFTELKKYPEIFDLPVFALKEGRIYPFGTEASADFEDLWTRDDGTIAQIARNKKQNINVGEKSIPITKIMEQRKNLSKKEKMMLASSVLEKNPFQIENTSDYNLFRAYSTGGGRYSFMSDMGKRGYSRILEEREIKALGRKVEDPIEMLKRQKEKFLETKKNITTADSSKFKTFYTNHLRPNLIATYGFGQAAAENGDIETSKLAEEIINEFGSIEECRKFVTERTDEQGNFKVLDIDVPREIRKKMSDLAKVV